MIAVTQVRGVGPGKDYVDKLMTEGKTKTEALRLLRRRLSNVVFQALRVDQEAPAGQQGHRSIAELDRPQPRS